MARCCDALFLLAMTEVAMTTVISSHVKDVSLLDTKVSSLEKSWYFISVYILKEINNFQMLHFSTG